MLINQTLQSLQSASNVTRFTFLHKRINDRTSIEEKKTILIKNQTQMHSGKQRETENDFLGKIKDRH